MSIRNLMGFLSPRSVAVIGASTRKGSVGRVVMGNIKSGAFSGSVYPVNPKYEEVAGLRCYARVAALPETPDLAVIATPAATVPGLIAELGQKGCRAVVVLSAGLTAANGLRQKMLDAARAHTVRVIGPNTIGLSLPRQGLNASFAHMAPAPGNLALLSQSGAIATSLLDWAADQDIGFSHVFSMGDMADVDSADLIDILATDPETSAILLYLESVSLPRKFLAAARAASRLKPIIAVKSGRHEQAAKAAATHTGALAGADNVMDAALRRAGILRVLDLDALFIAAETLSQLRPMRTARVGIVTNGGGAGVLGVDRLVDEGASLAELGAKTLAALDVVLPANWSRANPVDIIGDAPPQRYGEALEIVAADAGVDALLVMNCPTALGSSRDAAREVTRLVKSDSLCGKPVLACWLGEKTAHAGREILQKAGVPSFATPAEAGQAIGFLTRWTALREALDRVPSADGGMVAGDIAKVRSVLADVAAENRRMLTEAEAKSVIARYGIAVPALEIAPNADAVHGIAARQLERADAVVIKLVSRDVSHKSDVGGVALGLGSAQAAEAAAHSMAERVRKLLPQARIEGFAIQPMIEKPNAEEVLLGMHRDPIFGPVLMFGAGGTAVEVIRDSAIALPPLDDLLAREVIARTRISKLLKGYRDRPAADEAALVRALIGLSQLIIDFPAISGVDINPLLVDETGAMALDARIEIDPGRVGETGPNADLAIRPYPSGWARETRLKDGSEVWLRPIRPTDFKAMSAFAAQIAPEDLRTRFFAARRHFSTEAMRRLVQIDYDREMAFVAVSEADEALLGVAHLASDAIGEEAEFDVLVRSDLHGRGLGWALMSTLLTYARAEGLARLHGTMLSSNSVMIRMCRELGFQLQPAPEDAGRITAVLSLTEEAGALSEASV